MPRKWATYTKVLDLVKDLVVECEVITGNNIDPSLLLDVPMLKTKSFCLSKEVGLANLATPICFRSFLQLTVGAHARETEDRSTEQDIDQYTVAY